MELYLNGFNYQQPSKEEISSLVEVKKGESVIFFHDPAINRTRCRKYQGDGNCKIKFVNIITDYDY